MARPRHLKNAPIVEAIVDFRVRLPDEFKVQTFASIKKVLGDSYPQMEERREFEAGVKMNGKRVEQIFEEKGLVLKIPNEFIIQENNNKLTDSSRQRFKALFGKIRESFNQ